MLFGVVCFHIVQFASELHFINNAMWVTIFAPIGQENRELDRAPIQKEQKQTFLAKYNHIFVHLFKQLDYVCTCTDIEVAQFACGSFFCSILAVVLAKLGPTF